VARSHPRAHVRDRWRGSKHHAFLTAPAGRGNPIPTPARHLLRKFPMAGGLPAHAVPRMSWGEPAESWNKTSS
jgi:hypothetical protein